MISLDLPQQVWLRGMMTHLIVSEQQAKAMHKVAAQDCRVPYEARDYASTYSAVAKAIGTIGLELRRMVDELTGVHMVAIVNTRSDEMAQLATTFSSLEIEYIKLLVGEIFTAPHHAYCIASTHAVNLGRETEPELVSSKAEAVCKRLVRLGWLRQRRGGFYSLSSRSLLELQSYLRSAYEEYIHTCTVCKDIVTCGQTCPTPECDTFIHNHCRLNFESNLTRRSGEAICPSCKQDWRPIEVGNTAKAANARTSRRTRRTASERQNDGDDVGDDDDEQDADDDVETTQSTSQTRRGSDSIAEPRSNKRRRTNRRSAAADEEHDEGDNDATLRLAASDEDEASE